MVRSLGKGLALVLALAASPLLAQSYSNSYTFLKAVKERDGSKVTDLVSTPGSFVINTRDSETGNTALHIVVLDRDLGWLQFLLAKGAKADVANNSGETPLTLAAQIGWTEGAEALVRRVPNVDQPNSRGETALILAVQKRDLATTRMLLARGADPKRTDGVTGMSALDYARRDSRAGNIVRLLEAPQAQPAKAVQGPKL